MSKSWPFYSPHMLLLIGSSWVLMCLGMLHIKFHMVKCMLKSPFLEMSKSWHFYGPNMVLRISSLWVLINVPRDASSQISHCWVYLIAYPARNVQIIALLCPKHGLRFFFSYWFFLSFNECAQGCFMPYFTLLGVSCSPSCQKCQNHGSFMTQAPIYGPHMAHTWSL